MSESAWLQILSHPGGLTAAVVFLGLLVFWQRQTLAKIFNKLDDMQKNTVIKADCQLNMADHQGSINRLESDVSALTQEVFVLKGRDHLAREVIGYVRRTDAAPKKD